VGWAAGGHGGAAGLKISPEARPDGKKILERLAKKRASPLEVTSKHSMKNLRPHPGRTPQSIQLATRPTGSMLDRAITR